jgi:hypothetical protein
MTDPGAGRNASGDTLEALRSMLATMLGGAGRVSGQLGRVPAVGEVGRAAALMRQAVTLDVAATATQARLGVGLVRAAERGTSVAFAVGRGALLARAARRRR